MNEELRTPQYGENEILRGHVNEVAGFDNLKAGYCLPRLSGGKWVWCCQGKPYCNANKYQCDIICAI